MVDLFLAQVTDPFRIALVIGLILTMARNRAVTGTVVPLAAGILFIAVIIPTTLNRGDAALAPQIGVGLVSTALLAGVALAIRALILKNRA